MFADDCLMFAMASHSAATNILKTLNFFSKVSRQQINYHKFSLYFSSNVHSAIENDISCCLAIQHTLSIGKYLDIHNIVFWKDPINFAELILRMQKKLAGWKAGTLSRGGKLTLIKSTLAGLPNHVLSCFKCPSKITNRLDKECKDLFWGHQVKSPPIAWQPAWSPKECKDLLAWQIITEPNNWWVDLVKRKYLRHIHFFCNISKFRKVIIINS